MNVGKRSPKRHVRIDRFQMNFLLTALMFCLILYGVACDKGGEKLTQPAEAIPEQTLQHFSTNHTESGVTTWKLIADSGEFMKAVVYVQNPTIQIFEEGQVAITVTGDRGEIIQSSNDLKVFDNVVGIGRDGVLYTDELHWRNREGKLYAPNESEIVRGDSTMIGREMEGDASLEVVTMKTVRFNVYAKDEQIDAPEQVERSLEPRSTGRDKLRGNPDRGDTKEH